MKSQYQAHCSKLVELLFFEVIERIAVFHLHLKETDIRFFPPRSSNSSEKHFVDSFNECLSKMLHCAATIVDSYNAVEKDSELTANTIKQLGEILSAIKELHKSNLGHLPRPPEPPELKRFGRILQKHAVKLKESSRSAEISSSDISVYVGEEISETAYAGDPLVQFKLKNLNTIIDNTNKLPVGRDVPCIETFPEPVPENLGYHLTVPRIDATNPCRWPTLVHEVGHRLMDRSFFNHEDIQKEFDEFLVNAGLELPGLSGIRYSVKHWLTECWCDLFGAVIIGPSFWFAQWASFVFNSSERSMFEGCETHPPALFRLHLILKLLNHRFPEAISPEFKRAAFEAKKLLEEFDVKYEAGFVNSHNLRHIALLFQDYFFRHFFVGESDLNENLASLVKYTKGIEEGVINSMVKSLSCGLPIPSVVMSEEDTWCERASTVQEILLSAWLYRNTIFRDQVMKQVSQIIANNHNGTSGIWDVYAEDIVKQFNAFNFSVLRSLQVSEWFHLYEGEGDVQQLSHELLNKATINEKDDLPHSALVDYQIYKLIKSGEMRAIPIINLEKQLGSTSLDIRLGTSFQVYSPNQVGVVDFTNEDSISNANLNSTLVDLDFLQPITIAPGQFMLGHSMEYICLPLSVAAQVEGRSSFARLGIEIHMTAGFVDPGFQGVLTFEIYNAGPNPVRLYPGIRIGQLRFFKGSPPAKPYNRNPSAKYRGLLQHHNSLQFQDYEIKLLTSAVRPVCINR
jgi:dCTP deaminase